MKDLAKRMGDLATDGIHGLGMLAAEDEENPFGVVDLSAFELVTGISGIEAPDEVVSDDEPIVLSLRIPEVKFTIGTVNGLSDLTSGNPDDIQLSIVTTSIQSVFHQPFQMAADLMARAALVHRWRRRIDLPARARHPSPSQPVPLTPASHGIRRDGFTH